MKKRKKEPIDSPKQYTNGADLSTLKLALFITLALIFTIYTHYDMKKREKQAIEYINTHSNGNDTSINNAINEARVIYRLPYFIVKDIEYIFYL